MKSSELPGLTSLGEPSPDHDILEWALPAGSFQGNAEGKPSPGFVVGLCARVLRPDSHTEREVPWCCLGLLSSGSSVCTSFLLV